MSNIENYSGAGKVVNTINYAKMENNTMKIQKFVEYLHEFLPVIKKEFDDLDALNEKKPNQVFPIKMEALAAIYQAAGPLYEWYIEKAKR